MSDDSDHGASVTLGVIFGSIIMGGLLWSPEEAEAIVSTVLHIGLFVVAFVILLGGLRGFFR